MKLVTSSQMRELDRLAIEKHKIPALQLMENAGRGLALAVSENARKYERSVVVVCGKGNNGGDGLVAARHLISMGFEVSVVLLESSSLLSSSARANFEQLAPLTPKIYSITNSSDLSSLSGILAQSQIVIDAILGTGLENNVTGLYAGAIDQINSFDVTVFSADIPSGLSSDSGKSLGTSVNATYTVTFGLPKLGLFVGEGPQRSGRVITIEIGIPLEEINNVKSDFELIEPNIFSSLVKPRHSTSHKGDYGHVAVFAGSRGHLGACYLAALSVLRVGAGLVTLCIPEKAFNKFDARYPEVMCEGLPDDDLAFFTRSSLKHALEISSGKNAIAIGPAIGIEKETSEFANELIKNTTAPIVIDADGLNVLSIDSIKNRKGPVVLTPHPKEMASLCKTSVDDVLSNRVFIAKDLAAKSGAVVLLKGKNTVIADPSGKVWFNSTGNAGMASAGMGDALTGIVAGLLAQGFSAMNAAGLGAYLHGLAGDIAAQELSERALIASDLIRSIGIAYKRSFGDKV